MSGFKITTVVPMSGHIAVMQILRDIVIYSCQELPLPRRSSLPLSWCLDTVIKQTWLQNPKKEQRWCLDFTFSDWRWSWTSLSWSNFSARETTHRCMKSLRTGAVIEISPTPWRSSTYKVRRLSMGPYANIAFFGVWQTPRHNHRF